MANTNKITIMKLAEVIISICNEILWVNFCITFFDIHHQVNIFFAMDKKVKRGYKVGYIVRAGGFNFLFNMVKRRIYFMILPF